MAEKVLKRLEEQLNCSICLDTYTDPKLLQCFHVYCRQCLVRLVDRDQQGKLGLTCPTCRQVTPIPDRGVAGLQSAFHINQFLEIQESFQKHDPTEKAVADTSVKNRTPSAGEETSTTLYMCSDHPDEELKLYCETCGDLVCVRCIVKGGGHHDHDCEVLKKAFEKYKEEIASSLEPLEKQVTAIKNALAVLDACCGEVSNDQAATKGSIHDTFRKLRKVLDIREAKLIGQLDHITQSKLKDLASQRDGMETRLVQVSSCLHFTRQSVRISADNERDALLSKPNTIKKVKELTTPLQPDFLGPNAKAGDIVFSASADMTKACENYGQVCIPTLPDPSKCHVTGTGLEEAVIGETSSATLCVYNFDGIPCDEPILASLESELVSEIAGTVTSCSVEREGQSQYKISHQPTVKGRHQLHIRFDEQHIRGSPFSIAVKSLTQITPILTIEKVGGPWGVAVNWMGEVVVTERTLHAISVFSPRGKKLRSFGKFGMDAGEFQGPHGVAVDGDGNILVADEGNHRVQKFNIEAQFLTAMGTKGSGRQQFRNPSSIAFNPINRKVYVVDKGNDRVQVLNSDLTFSSTIGKEGSGKGQFRSPCVVACDSTGKVYVVDADNHRIQVFTAEGKFLRMFGRRGKGKKELDYPIDIAIDASGTVYVSEGTNDCISQFTPEGQFVTCIGRSGSGPGEFDFPRGIAVDDCGVVYVCDCNNNRIQVL